MAIQISITYGGVNYPAALVLVQTTNIKYFPVAADTKIEVGVEVFIDRASRDAGDPPQYSFGIQLVPGDLNLTQPVSGLRLQLETALRNLCSAEASNPQLNSGHRIATKLRTAIIAAGATVAN